MTHRRTHRWRRRAAVALGGLALALGGATAAAGDTDARPADPAGGACADPGRICPFARLHCGNGGREELRDAASGSFRIRWRTRPDCGGTAERPHYRHVQPWPARLRRVDGLGIELPGRGHRNSERWPPYWHLERGRPRHGDNRAHGYRPENGVRRYSTHPQAPRHSTRR